MVHAITAALHALEGAVGRAYAERLRDGAGALLEAGHAAGAEGRGVGLLGELAQVPEDEVEHGEGPCRLLLEPSEEEDDQLVLV